MRLHMLGLPHTRTVQAMSHCAYTGKVLRFGPMMAAEGFEVIHYGVGPPESPGWADFVEVLTPAQQEELLGYDPLHPSPEFVGRSTHVQSKHYQAFNAALKPLLESYVRGDDIVCLPFGHGHEAALTPRILKDHAVETGIGYPTCITGYRIYESQAWFHWHLGRADRRAWLSEWVVPNYFDPADWPLRPTDPLPDQYVLYFGRITPEKGMNVVWNLAKLRPDLTFLLVGQGDPSPWLAEKLPNLRALGPVAGRERARIFHGARCVLLPTEYVEPFGGVAVEAMLTGTPVLTSDHGAFTETVPSFRRCHTAGDWMLGLDETLQVHPASLRAYATNRYAMGMVGPKYARIFRDIPGLRTHGWQAGTR